MKYTVRLDDPVWFSEVQNTLQDHARHYSGFHRHLRTFISTMNTIIGGL